MIKKKWGYPIMMMVRQMEEKYMQLNLVVAKARETICTAFSNLLQQWRRMVQWTLYATKWDCYGWAYGAQSFGESV